MSRPVEIICMWGGAWFVNLHKGRGRSARSGDFAGLLEPPGLLFLPEIAPFRPKAPLSAPALRARDEEPDVRQMLQRSRHGPSGWGYSRGRARAGHAPLPGHAPRRLEPAPSGHASPGQTPPPRSGHAPSPPPPVRPRPRAVNQSRSGLGPFIGVTPKRGGGAGGAGGGAGLPPSPQRHFGSGVGGDNAGTRRGSCAPIGCSAPEGRGKGGTPPEDSQWSPSNSQLSPSNSQWSLGTLPVAPSNPQSPRQPLSFQRPPRGCLPVAPSDTQ